ncbi:WGR domain-containing protein [Nannocystis radixulma]|uniref:WGR domain-containing protein n=1 Tax=Nannocystis radixulma TaxID=2995305 RepID=A0ABT5BBK4_9BACT|nr:WGR domain-containing protein [Nannocystis radixulma]MDC0671020.1 WGR domain-containing protein [Nannocystis radixulma]
MKLIRRVSLGLREGSSDKVYIVDLCEVSKGKFVVNFQFGRRGAPLKDGTKTEAPVSENTARSVFAKLVDEKKRKGYAESAEAAAVGRTLGGAASETAPAAPGRKASSSVTSPAEAILARLQGAPASRKPWSPARVAWRAGEYRLREAVPHLIRLIGSGDQMLDYCIAWALARCGDGDTFAALARARNEPGLQASSLDEALKLFIPRAPKSDLVMRMTLEMLRGWSDELREAVAARARVALPPTLREFAGKGDPEAFTAVLLAGLASGDAAALEDIYRIDDDTVRPGLLAGLRTIPLQVGSFRHVRHVFKMAEVRGDAEVFGLIAHRIEKTPATFGSRRNMYLGGRWTDVSKELKRTDSRLAYSSNTRDYLRRRTFRSLRRLAEAGDALGYVKLAVGVLLPFTDADGQETRQATRYSYSTRKNKVTRWDRFAAYHAFNAILYGGNSPRYEPRVRGATWRCRSNYKPGDPAPAHREESFPKIWDQVPLGLMHLLSESACSLVHEFAVKAIRDNKTFLAELDVDGIVMLLERPFEVTAQLGFELAKARYNPDDPDLGLIAAVANCAVPAARKLAHGWIDADRNRFAGAHDLLVALLFSRHEDTRAYARVLLQGVPLPAAAASTLIARVVAGVLALPDTPEAAAIAGDVGETLMRAFARPLRSVGLNVVVDLVAHPLLGAQTLAANILLNHDTRPEDLPEQLIAALAVESKHAAVRSLGIRLFGELPDSVLVQRGGLMLAFLTSAHVDQRDAIRPVVQRLAGRDPAFAAAIVGPLIGALLVKEAHEGVHSFVLRLLKTDLDAALGSVDKDLVMRLLRAKAPAAQELGGLLLERNVDPDTLDVGEVARLGSHEILAVRHAAWQFFERNVDRVRRELPVAIKLLDAKWDDSRAFAFGFFRESLQPADYPPDVLVAIADSVRADVQAFGREMITRCFREEHGLDYLRRLSEHPSADVQLFATNYLEQYAAGSIERLRELTPYFLGVLSRVNRARVAKARVFRFLTAEALKSPEAAQLVAELMTRQSLTMAIGDRAASIVAMVGVREHFGDVPMPIEIRQPPVRTKGQVQRGV